MNPSFSLSSRSLVGNRIAFAGAGLLAFGVSTYPVFMTSGVVFWVLGGLLTLQTAYQGPSNQQAIAGWVWLMPMVVWATELFGLFHPGEGIWDEIRVALPLVLLPAVAFQGLPLTRQQVAWVLRAYVLGVVLTLAWTLLHYQMHQAVIDEAIARSKSLPILKLGANPFQLHGQEDSYYSHIYFSLLHALAALFALREALVASKRARWLWAVVGVFLVLGLHMLTGRTGLLAFWGAVGVLAVVAFSRRGNWRLLVLSGLLAVSLPVAAYFAVPAFTRRVDVTAADLSAISQEQDLSRHSLTRRYVTYSAAWHIGVRHPLWGIGPQAIDDSLAAQYPRERLQLDPDMRLSDPHNQYLEQWLGAGLLGLAAFLLWMITGVRFSREAPYPWLALGLVLVVVLASGFEGVLERQRGVSAVVLLWLLYLVPPKFESSSRT